MARDAEAEAAAQPMGRVPIPDPTLLTTAALKLSIENLKELLETKIEKVHERIDLLIEHRKELKEENSKALAAALAAQERLFAQQNKCSEDAASKQELSVTKQLESISTQAALSRQALDERITALKERIDRGGGKEEQKSESRATAGWLAPMIAVGSIALISLVIQLLALMQHATK